MKDPFLASYLVLLRVRKRLCFLNVGLSYKRIWVKYVCASVKNTWLYFIKLTIWTVGIRIGELANFDVSINKLVALVVKIGKAIGSKKKQSIKNPNPFTIFTTQP